MTRHPGRCARRYGSMAEAVIITACSQQATPKPQAGGATACTRPAA
jgi:hypothetical protein